MAKREFHRVNVTNPRPASGEAEVVVRGSAKYYLIVPVGEDLFEIHYGGKYLGESTSLSGAESFIQRGGASAPVLIQNPNGGYEMYTYNSPTPKKSNPKKKSKKRAKKRSKKKATRKKKSTKKKAKKKTKKTSVRKKKRISSAKKKVKKAKKKAKSTKKKASSAKKKASKAKKKAKSTKKKVSSAKKKASKAKKKVKKAKTALRKAKRSPNPGSNPSKGRKHKKKGVEKAEPKKKVSVDAAVRNHITKTTGKRPAW